MRKRRFSEEQILRVLQEQAAGGATAEVCRRHGSSEWTFSRWRSTYGGIEVAEATRLQAQEDEHRLASLADARHTVEAWCRDDNAVRPHGGRGSRTPTGARLTWTTRTATLPITAGLSH